MRDALCLAARMAAVFAGMICLGVALFGTVSHSLMPDGAAHVLLAAIGIGAMARGITDND